MVVSELLHVLELYRLVEPAFSNNWHSSMTTRCLISRLLRRSKMDVLMDKTPNYILKIKAFLTC